MCTVRAKIEQIQALNLESEVVSSIEATEEDYIAKNTQEELFTGIDATGNQISPNYKSMSYARKKAARNSLPGFGVPDLKLTGEFYNRFTLKVDRAEIEVNSDVPYAKYLEARYGKRIYGLTDKLRAEYAFGPFWGVLKERIEAVTGLTFK